MKLSQMTTNQAAEVLVTIMPEIGKITSDNDLIAMLRDGETDKENMDSAISFGIQKIVYLIPSLLGKHRESVFIILSTIYGKTSTEISQQPVGKTIAMIKETVQDKDLLSFFQSSAQSE